MITNGFIPAQNGRRLTNKSSEESKWLYLVVQALKAVAARSPGDVSPILQSIDTNTADTSSNTQTANTYLSNISSATGVFNTYQQHELSTGTDPHMQVQANTVHSITIVNISGSTTIQVDGGESFVLPANGTITYSATTVLQNNFDITTAGDACVITNS